MTEKELKIDPFGNGGIHLCGFVGETLEPSIWHIHNGKSQAKPNLDIKPELVNAVNDVSADDFRKIWWNNGFRDGTYLAYNGEIGPYKLFLKKYGN